MFAVACNTVGCVTKSLAFDMQSTEEDVTKRLRAAGWLVTKIRLDCEVQTIVICPNCCKPVPTP